MKPIRRRAIGVLAASSCLIVVACTGASTASAPSHPECTATSEDPARSVCWEIVAPMGSGGFPPEPGSNDSPQWEPGRWPMTIEPIVAFGGELWGTSQTHAWSSHDGLHWTEHAKTDWGERINVAYAYFGERLWMFGGLRYADRVPLNDVWSSADGATWTNVGTAAWSPRRSHAVVVFHDALWLFGGADRVNATSFATEHATNDVWTSSDGAHWTLVTSTAPWSPREGAKVVVFDDALVMLGADDTADVWRSDDGAHWTQLSAGAEWGPRFAYGAQAFGGELWVYGGYEGKSTNAVNDVWISSDARTWTRQAEHAPWGPRMPRTIVYDDKIWIFSGKHTGAPDNWGGDIWTMTLR